MKCFSRFLSVFVCLVLVLSLLPAANAATVKTQITTLEELTTGQYTLVCPNTKDGDVQVGNLDGTWIKCAEAVWTITVTENGIKLADGNGVYVAPKTGNNNGITQKEYVWSVTCEDGKFAFHGQGSDTTTLAYNATNDGFRSYKNTTVENENYAHDFILYRVEEEAEPSETHAAQIGQTKYETLAAAFEAAQNGRIFSTLVSL